MAINHHTAAAERAYRAGALRVVPAIVIAVMTMVIVPAQSCHAEAFLKGLPGMPKGTDHFAAYPKNKSMVEARTGYMWGVNTMWLRDGDNHLLPPGKKEVSLESPVFGVQGETRAVTDDLALRVQGWINLPQTTRGDFQLDREGQALISRSWETQSRYLAADVAAIYHLGPFGYHRNRFDSIGMPYTAALAAGYRYVNFDYRSSRSTTPTGTFHDHFHIHIPYIGVHYAHEDFVGSLVRLDINASPFTFSRMDAERHLTGEITQFEGDSVTGFWFESFFSWSKPMSDGVYIGVFVNYNYLELSGGATVTSAESGVLSTTRFSMDTISHLAMVGLSGVITF
ncbi:MAG: hypothetical protein RDU20_12325 [Desulfomonilaceae bacterium]|nr:hypothetical protein [Desulfomonilaceae bacterium]